MGFLIEKHFVELKFVFIKKREKKKREEDNNK